MKSFINVVALTMVFASISAQELHSVGVGTPNTKSEMAAPFEKEETGSVQRKEAACLPANTKCLPAGSPLAPTSCTKCCNGWTGNLRVGYKCK